MVKEYRFMIGEDWRSSTEMLDVHNPYNGELVGRVHMAQEGDVEDALRTAERAFEVSRSLPAHRRGEILETASDIIRSRRGELARSIVLEAGKPIRDAEGEVDRAIITFWVASSEARRFGGEIIPLDLTPASEGRVGLIQRFPLGPVLGISPFNFPLNLVSHKVAPAIAVGNPIIIKPASATPITALLLADIVREAGLPSGCLTVLPVRSSLAERMVTDPRIKKLTFTGSAEVGWRLKQKAYNKRVTLELGGNAGLIIHSDADVEKLIPRVVTGSFSYSGQSCISVQRILVHQPSYEAFLEKFVRRTETLRLGDPLDRNVDVGPMIDEKAAAKAEEWVKKAASAGAKILTGGQRDGAFLKPTILTDVKHDMEVSCNEVFAPVVTVAPYTDFREAVRIVNDSRYGLQAGIYTSDMGRILYAFRNLEVGGIMVNDVPTFRVENMPYGGVKDSGYGREGLRYAMEEMTEMRLLALKVD